MRKSLLLFVLLLAVFFTYTVIAQELGSIRKGHEITIPQKIHKLVLDPLPAGTYTIGTAGDFPTIDSAFNKLSIDGIAGSITFALIDEFYTAPTDNNGFLLNGPIPGADENNRVIIQPAENKNVTIQGEGTSIFQFYNTSYLTVDGISLTGNTTLNIHAFYNDQLSWNDAIEFWDNSNQNVIKNITAASDDINRSGCGIIFYVLTASSSPPDSNLIQNNIIKSAALGILISAFPSSNKGEGNIIRSNYIGSDSDSLIAWGIQLAYCHNTLAENNIVQNMTVTNEMTENINIGINSYWGSDNIIRNNVVHNIKASNGYTSVGILLSGAAGNVGYNNIIYNNMVYDVQSTSKETDSRVTGIQMWYQINSKIYYNSVYLNGNGNGANPAGSAALYIYSNCTNVESKNNLFINTRDESPYCASSVFDYSTSNLTSDNNDLYYVQNANNCLVNAGGTDYYTLEEWQATGQDLYSITEMPNFIEPYLHIDETIATDIESHATPFAEIDIDFDGDPRNATTPDVGADEFDGFTPVELNSFSANIINGSVQLNWSTATETNNRGFDVQRSSEGTDYISLGFVNGYGTTTQQHNYSFTDKNLNQGSYSYRLKQYDFDGSFHYSDVVKVDFNIPLKFALEQNYPNPFNPSTKIKYSVPQSSKVIIKVFDVLGNEIETLVNEEKPAGTYELTWNAANLPSGVYFYQIKAGEFTTVKKMILLK